MCKPCFLFLPVKPGVCADKFLDSASKFNWGSNFKGLRCTSKIDALPFIFGSSAMETKQAYCDFCHIFLLEY